VKKKLLKFARVSEIFHLAAFLHEESSRRAYITSMKPFREVIFYTLAILISFL